MPYRVIATPRPSPESDLDTPEMIEVALAVERDERCVHALNEVVEIGLRLMRAQEGFAIARLAAVAAEGAALNLGEDPAASYNKLAQTIRRTVALQIKVAEDAKGRRAGLTTEMATRRAKRAKDHENSVRDAITTAVGEAFHADIPDTNFEPVADPDTPDPIEIERNEMLNDVELLLEDVDDYGDWLNRPVGETVAKLCEALGLGSDMCVKRGDSWLVRRCNTPYEIMRQDASGVVRSLRALNGQRPTAKPSGRESVVETHRRC